MLDDDAGDVMKLVIMMLVLVLVLDLEVVVMMMMMATTTMMMIIMLHHLSCPPDECAWAGLWAQQPKRKGARDGASRRCATPPIQFSHPLPGRVVHCKGGFFIGKATVRADMHTMALPDSVCFPFKNPPLQYTTPPETGGLIGC
jgi:hypothetical protein